ncbi:universal stress protein [Alkalicoccus daliensis]|uniref:Nucleotide-binding universal stress protein, UspA family n=1 Tax=Alkalicoccus daliensis TaxID=745820 RepID=A0A1H0INY2_9BACI|nr:universal stress protein [Alkalicoccus daliensis]SDO33082.1 Nucleotide-binding universal stress protein, UspA family [Alkalicoccus daliensis]
MFKKILLAIDGSKHSERATEKAIELAKLQDSASIEMLYVVAGNKSKSDVLHYGDSDTASLKRKRLLADYKEMIEAENISTDTTVLHGKDGTAEAIIAHANEHDYDVLVLGSRGLNTMQTMVLGSVSHKVVKYVKAPVLMVK